jgi:heat-inducible transcriptional repressor
MDKRQHNLLAEVVRSYIREAEPVGSKALEGALGVSSATIRNDMAELEEQGFLAQPYTSAGRVPTLKGYQFFIDNLLEAREPKITEQRLLKDLVKQLQASHEAVVKNLARKLAELAGEAVVVGFAPYDVYYTGLANLFEQPEFAEVNMVRHIGKVIDNLDQAMAKLYHDTNHNEEVGIKIGLSNPFGEGCALIFTSCRNLETRSLIGLLGPIRMDYDAHIGRLQYIKSLFTI